MRDRPAGGADVPPAVLVLTGGLVHLVHQLAVLRDLPELAPAPRPAGDPSPPPAPPAIGLLVTGVLRHDPQALARVHGAIARWLPALRQLDPLAFGGVRLLAQEDEVAT